MLRILVGFPILLAVAMLLHACKSAVAGNDSIRMDPGRPVLVELYTSEGCSSCPPADRTLATLERGQPVPGADIIALAFHVDYWDTAKWRDKYSSPMYSRRQENYGRVFNLDSIYTPEMVVNGSKEFIGNDQKKAAKAITETLNSPAATVCVTIGADRFSITVNDLPEHEDSTAYLAIAEDGITSPIEGGENSGETLHHMAVVRELRALGVVNAANSEYEFEGTIPFSDEWMKDNLKYVVFIQENGRRRVIAAGVVRPADQAYQR